MKLDHPTHRDEAGFVSFVRHAKFAHTSRLLGASLMYYGVTILAMSSTIGLVGAAQVPAPAPRAKPVFYFPTTVGTKWVYQEGDRENVEVVTDVVQKETIRRVTVSSEWNGKLTPRYAFSVSDKGIGLVGSDAGKLDEPFWYLKLPNKPGDKWDVVLAITGVGKWTGKATVRDHERVEVPAGKFDAICVETDMEFLGERRHFSRWYAPGVGVVKETRRGGADRVLKSFTTGKE